MEVERSEQTWTNLAGLFSDLKDKIHPGAAGLLTNELDQGKTRSVIQLNSIPWTVYVASAVTVLLLTTLY